jgi:hypothetical protein
MDRFNRAHKKREREPVKKRREKGKRELRYAMYPYAWGMGGKNDPNKRPDAGQAPQSIHPPRPPLSVDRKS